MRHWLAEIDFSDVPMITPSSGDPPACLSDISKVVCNWACDKCAGDDVVECPDQNVWGLTFDGGPTEATPGLLTFLDEQKVKATFFLSGANVVQYPEIIVAEVRWTEKAILEATGLCVRYIRPPNGNVDNRVRSVLKKLGYTVVDWGGDTFDSDDSKTSEMSNDAVKARFQKTIQLYASQTANNIKGFISREHDLTKENVEVAKA
ncbi:chitin deacetylase [Linnemannia gamsii]|uniref:Chitin deacetylase n=1 Tax=Linnemannia gamsii TaxID=64522 RepID=A0ABQ7KB01_9FUNG|nr:chitin deacetylase [Linnemannia gamsii]